MDPSSLRESPSASSSSRNANKQPRSTADYSLSCAECRRLKLKCSRQQWPCETCIKRGIAHLCPDGVQTKEKSKGQLKTSKKVPMSASNESSSTYVEFDAAESSSIASRLINLEKKIDLLIQAASSGSHASISMPPQNGSLHDLASVATDHYALEGGNANTSISRDSEDAIRDQQGVLARQADGRAHYVGSSAHSMYLTREDSQDGLSHRRVLFREDLPSRPGSPTPIDLEVITSNHAPNTDTDTLGTSPQGMTPSTTESQPSHLVWATPGFRSPYSSTAIWNILKSSIPEKSIARRMIDVYYASVTFMFHPITREDFDELIWKIFYDEQMAIPYTSTPPPGFHSHKLALLYSMLSLGVLLDVQRPQRDPVGKALYSCAWSALAMSNFTEASSLDAILSLMHIIMYLTWRRGGKYAESAYPLLGTMMRLAISMGLHRDPINFTLEENDRERRRRVFWDIQCCEVFRSFSFCRPPALCDRHVDTRLPSAWKEVYGEASEMMPSPSTQSQGFFHAYKCRQTQIMNRMLDECLCSNSLYRTTMKFDQELRQMLALMPIWMQPSLIDFDQQAEHPKDDLEATYSDVKSRDTMIFELQRHTTLINQHQALLLLHRGWFSQAIQAEDQPLKPSEVDGKVEPISERKRLDASVIAVNESASKIINVTISAWCRYPSLIIRWAFFWTAVFSAAVCRGLYLVKSLSIDAEAIIAYNDLQRAITLFRKAVVGWAPLESPLGILERLKIRADVVINNGHTGSASDGAAEGQKEGEDLELIGDGRKRRKSNSNVTSAKRTRRNDLDGQLQKSNDLAIYDPPASTERSSQWPDEANMGLPPLFPSSALSLSITDDNPMNYTPADTASFDNGTSASSSQLLQMLSTNFGWDDISIWNDLIVDL